MQRTTPSFIIVTICLLVLLIILWAFLVLLDSKALELPSIASINLLLCAFSSSHLDSLQCFKTNLHSRVCVRFAKNIRRTRLYRHKSWLNNQVNSFPTRTHKWIIKEASKALFKRDCAITWCISLYFVKPR